MRSRQLDRLFRAIVMSVSAPAAVLGWASCNDSPDTPDAGDGSASVDAADATSADRQESSIGFADTGALDSYVVWCDAGPPEWLGSDVSGDQYYSMPCGLPTGDYVTEAGIINRCDQFCPTSARSECAPVDPGTMATLFPDAGIEPADAGDAATGPGLYVMCGTYQGGRKPTGLRKAPCVRASGLGGYFAEMSFFESAAVHAFRRMKRELARCGASPRLLARIDRAASDEMRHTTAMDRLARRFGVTARRASVRRVRPRSARDMARENAIEGCVEETYSALLATWQAAHARDPEIRRVMSRVARDETRHAELSWEVARVLDRHLDDRARRALVRAQAKTIRELRARMGREPAPALVNLAGIPAAADAQRLVDALASALWAN